MARRIAILPIFIVLAGVLSLGAGDAPVLAMLDRVEPGQWDLLAHDTRAGIQSLCLRDGRRLIQLRHPDLACDHVILQDQPNEVTVQYSCPGRGYGRTHIRRETPHLLQIEAQGIAQGFPFEFAVEARRTGDCPR